MAKLDFDELYKKFIGSTEASDTSWAEDSIVKKNSTDSEEIAEDLSNYENFQTKFTAEEFNCILDTLGRLKNASNNTEIYEAKLVDSISEEELGSKKYIFKEGESCSLEFYPVYSHQKGISKPTSDIGDGSQYIATISASIKSKETSEVVNIYENIQIDGVNDNTKGKTIDISNLIESDGTYYLTLSITINDSEENTDTITRSKSKTYNITIIRTNISLSFQNNDWWNRVFDADSYSVIEIPLSISGDGSCKIHYEVKNISSGGTSTGSYEEISVTPSSNNSQSIYLSNPVVKKDSVFEISIYMYLVDDSSVKTDTIKRQFICINSNSHANTKLIAVNDLLTTVEIGSKVDLFQYMVFDGSSDGTVSLTIKETRNTSGTSKQTSTTNPNLNTALIGSTGTIYTYNTDLSGEENSGTLVLSVSIGSTSVSNSSISNKTIQLTVDSTKTAVSGAKWNLSTSRSNDSDDKLKIKSSIVATGIYNNEEATWTNVLWINDGWTTYKNGDNTLPCLRLNANSKCVTGIRPLSGVNGSVERTIEFNYLVKNTTDETSPIISILRSDSKGGILVYPKKVSVFSTNITPGIDTTDVPVSDEEKHHVCITIQPSWTYTTYKGKFEGGKLQLIRVYVDGIESKVFKCNCVLDTSTSGFLTYGGTGADLYVFGTRVYEKALSYKDIVQNNVSWKETDTDKVNFYNKNIEICNIPSDSPAIKQDMVLKTTYGIDFSKVCFDYNIFVLECKDSNKYWPSKYGQTPTDSDPTYGTLYYYANNSNYDTSYVTHTGHSFKATNCIIEKQGTSSSNYLEYNLYFKLQNETKLVTDSIGLNDGEAYKLVEDENGVSPLDDGYITTYEKDGDSNKIYKIEDLSDDDKSSKLYVQYTSTEAIDEDISTYITDLSVVTDPTTGEKSWVESEKGTWSKKVKMFDGMEKTSKIVMKKNWASQMQDHKIGSVNGYNDVYRFLLSISELNLGNAAMKLNNNIRVSTFQEPMLGFFKETDASGKVYYTFKGLFTGGPHKKDDAVFGWDVKTYKNIMVIEGSENSSPFTRFQIPWSKSDSSIIYNGDAELLSYAGMDSWDLTYVGNGSGKKYTTDCGNSDTDTCSKIKKAYEDRFRPAYCIVNECNPFLTYFNGSYTELAKLESDYSAQVAEIDAYNALSTTTTKKSYPDVPEELKSYYSLSVDDYNHFFVTKSDSSYNQYDLFYWDFNKKKILPVTDVDGNIINLKSQLCGKGYKYDWSVSFTSTGNKSRSAGENELTESSLSGKTNDELVNLFKKARLDKFYKEAGSYWDIYDSCLHRCWVEWFAGTDQCAKNTYPYYFGLNKDNEGDTLWRWYIDDTDTIGPVNNTGYMAKEYNVEPHDKNESGSPYFNAENNVFFNLLEEAFEVEYFKTMQYMFNAMGKLGDDTKVSGFYSRYFKTAKKYYPEIAYNIDAELYEISEMNNEFADSTDTNKKLIAKLPDALPQVWGNALSAESKWYEDRIDYMYSKYIYDSYRGAQSSSTALDGSTGTASASRLGGKNTIITFTAYREFYPTLWCAGNVLEYSSGQNMGGVRTKEGDTATVTWSMDGDQVFYIYCGASNWSDIGDWSSANLTSSEGTSFSFVPFTKAKRIVLENSNKTSNTNVSIAGITVGNSQSPNSFKEILITNVPKLTSINGLEYCNNLEKLNASGTNVSSFKFSPGCPLNHVEFPSTVNEISMTSLLDLTSSEMVFDGYTNISSILIHKMSGVKPLTLLYNIYNAQKSNKNLVNISLTDIDESFSGTNGIAVLDMIQSLTTDNGYYGYDSNDNTSNSIKPTISGNLKVEYTYRTTITALNELFPNLTISADNYYIDFADSNVKSILLDLMGITSDITEEGASALKSLKYSGYNDSAFYGNILISSFNELKYFTGIKSLDSNMNDWDTNLSQAGGGGYRGCFHKCSALKSIDLSNITSIGQSCFAESGLVSVNAPKLTSLGSYAFRNCSDLTTVTSLGSITSLEMYTFMNCTSLESIVIPSTVETLAAGVFSGCKSLKVVHIPAGMKTIGSSSGGTVPTFSGSDGITYYVHASGTSIPTLAGPAYLGNISKIYVPTGMKSKYASNSSWSSLSSYIEEVDFTDITKQIYG